jgi:hypothetical protein
MVPEAATAVGLCAVQRMSGGRGGVPAGVFFIA